MAAEVDPGIANQNCNCVIEPTTFFVKIGKDGGGGEGGGGVNRGKREISRTRKSI